MKPYTPTNGTCCSCGYSGEDAECTVQADGTHCIHWWSSGEDEDEEE